MALHEDDRILRRTGTFRDNKNLFVAGLAGMVVIVGIVILLLMVPRADTSGSSIEEASRAPAQSKTH
jgi:hypothetical protein